MHDIGVGISTGMIGAAIALSFAWVEVTRIRTVASLAIAQEQMSASRTSTSQDRDAPAGPEPSAPPAKQPSGARLA